MDYTSKDFYVPTINFFESGNILTGSCNGMNYKVIPKSSDEGKQLLVQLWYGPMNLEHSDLVAQQEFAQSKERLSEEEKEEKSIDAKEKDRMKEQYATKRLLLIPANKSLTEAVTDYYVRNRTFFQAYDPVCEEEFFTHRYQRVRLDLDEQNAMQAQGATGFIW